MPNPGSSEIPQNEKKSWLFRTLGLVTLLLIVAAQAHKHQQLASELATCHDSRESTIEAAHVAFFSERSALRLTSMGLAHGLELMLRRHPEDIPWLEEEMPKKHFEIPVKITEASPGVYEIDGIPVDLSMVNAARKLMGKLDPNQGQTPQGHSTVVDPAEEAPALQKTPVVHKAQTQQKQLPTPANAVRADEHTTTRGPQP